MFPYGVQNMIDFDLVFYVQEIRQLTSQPNETILSALWVVLVQHGQHADTRTVHCFKN